MQCSVIISPQELQDRIISESKRIVKAVYGKDVSGIYYRVQTKQYLDHPRRLFLKGNGEVLEFDVHPHITLVQNFELTQQNLNKLSKELEGAIKGHQPFSLYPIGIGDYNEAFTLYVEFKADERINNLYQSILATTKEYMPQERYEKYSGRVYVPHATLIYDDISPEKIKEAKSMLNQELFNKPIHVTAIELWDITSGQRKIVQKYPLLNS